VSEQATQHIEFLAIPDLVERWQTTPSKLHRLIEERYLGALRVDGVLRIPAEFVAENEPLQGLRGTLLALHDAGFSDEQAVWWLLNENDELGERPVVVLMSGRKSAVRRATQALAF
jgi:hypothetical protein